MGSSFPWVGVHILSSEPHLCDNSDGVQEPDNKL